MNIIKLIILILLTILFKKPESITIEHKGISDKTIFPIVIFKDNSLISLKDYNTYNVNDKIYSSLRKTVLSYRDSKYDENDFGSFNITIINKDGVVISRYLNNKYSLELFNRLIKTLKLSKKNSDLISRLEVQEQRISN